MKPAAPFNIKKLSMKVGAEEDESKTFTNTSQNLVLQQRIRRCFIKNGPFLITGQPDILIDQVGNVISIRVNVSKGKSAYQSALSTWEFIRGRMKSEGWKLLHDEVYEQGDGMIYFFLGAEELVCGRLSLDEYQDDRHPETA